MSDITLILGGARSGKSARALALAQPAARRVFIATAQAADREMRDRIDQHRRERDSAWVTHEAPLALPETLAGAARAGVVCVVDCLTLWLSNVMHREHSVADAVARLEQSLRDVEGEVILVSNEVGLGLVPETPLGRRFRDAQGRLNARIAALATRVEFIAAGLPLVLKGAPRCPCE